MRKTLIAALLLIVSTTIVRAEDQPNNSAALSNFLSWVGGKVETSTDKNPGKITLTLDQAKAIENWKVFQKIGLLNEDFDQSYVNSHRIAITMVISLGGAMFAVLAQYRDTKIDKTNFAVYAQLTDLFGHDQTQLLYSFGFDRALFNKINWDKFETANLMKVAPGFTISPWLKAHMSD
jgi:hypothetical protein